MAISSSTRKAGPFIGNDATTVFPFAFKVFTTADLRVVRTNALGVESDLVLDTDYTVTLNSNQDNDPGGTVTRGTALPTGERLTITSDVEALQPLVLTNNGGFYPRVINDAFDKITIIAQQLIEQVGRSLKLPISSSASATLPDPVANRLIAWNSSANGFTNVNPASLATVAAYADANLELFTGNGTQTAFTLAQDPAVLANLDVSISGVTQVGGEDFTWIGTTLTFVVAPPTGTRIQVRYTRAIPPADLAAAVAAAEADRVATAADRVQTGLDVIAAEADRVATAADRVQTGLDVAATAADRVQTGLDRVATAADRVQTGLDVAATSNKQPLDADLTAIAALTSAADKMPYATGAQAWAMTDLTAAGRALLDDVDAAAQRTTLAAVGTADLAASTGAALVGSIQSGTGAAARTVQAKLRDTVSIKDFGAVGDGSTNNTVAIQAAIDAVFAAGGGTVEIPAGQFNIATAIVQKSGVRIVGQGYGSRLHSTNTTRTGAIVAVGTLGSELTGLSVQNLRLTSTYTTANGIPTGNGIRWDYVDDSTIINVWANNWSDSGVALWDSDRVAGVNILIEKTSQGYDVFNDCHDCTLTNATFRNIETYVGLNVEGLANSGLTKPVGFVGSNIVVRGATSYGINILNALKPVLSGWSVSGTTGTNIYGDGSGLFVYGVEGAVIGPGVAYDNAGHGVIIGPVADNTQMTGVTTYDNTLGSLILSNGGLTGTAYDVHVGSSCYFEEGAPTEETNTNFAPSELFGGAQFNNVANASTTVLDWYEEGSFTPSVIGTTTPGVGTYSVQLGRFTRIGNMVHFSIDLAWSAHTGTGDIAMAGLPYASTGTLNHAVTIRNNGLTGTSGSVFEAIVPQASSGISINQYNAATGFSTVPMDTSVAGITLTGSYRVAT